MMQQNNVLYDTAAGVTHPLGAKVVPDGINFAVFSAHATRVDLCLFDDVGDSQLCAIPMQKTDNVWHILVKGIGEGQLYGFRAYGPYAPNEGKLFNPNKLLLDPYAKAIKGNVDVNDVMFPYRKNSAPNSFSSMDSAPVMPKAVVIDDNFDWQGDEKPNIPWKNTIVYETNVKGMTILNNDVPEPYRGKFLGLSCPAIIKYFQELGITTLELMPVHNFFINTFLQKKGLGNLWGYESLCFFAPHTGYLVDGDISEFKQMVRDLHKAGIEVLLDVVFNHTAEGNIFGPMLSYKGLDNEVYYKLDKNNPMNYVDETGCGASFNLDNDVVVKLVTDALHYWDDEMHVDGFRFDLAVELTRKDKYPSYDSKFLQAIVTDTKLSKLKLIAEPWDLGPDGYKLGWFPKPFCEWNDKYRDTIRRFWRGEMSMLPELAKRMDGSRDIFKDRAPFASVNFITAHDGFSLYDLVSYDEKHNFANEEDNRDGSSNNFSWNSGVEGETDNQDVKLLRYRRMRSMIATLLISAGVPMIFAGDEMARTKKGNNNTYCQDNENGWLNWHGDERQQDFWRFVAALIKLRKSLLGSGYKDLAFLPSAKELGFEDWFAGFSRSISYVVEIKNSDNKSKTMWFVILNAYDGSIDWTLPSYLDDTENPIKWQLWIDTAITKDGNFGGDVFEKYNVQPWSVVCFKGI